MSHENIACDLIRKGISSLPLEVGYIRIFTSRYSRLWCPHPEFERLNRRENPA
jgi:hypothetical protein